MNGEIDAVKVKNLTVSYGSGQPTVQNVSFTVKKGTAVVITGPSGCGKSTICSALCGLIPEAIKGTVSGSIEIDGKDISGMSVAEISQIIGMVFQNPDDQLICSTVEDEIAFTLENMCVEPDEIRRRVDEQLKYFKIEKLALRDPSKMSGGQKKLVTIASVLISGPKIIILDEPMTGLDAPSRELVNDTIHMLKKSGHTLIIVEHWLETVDYADEFIYVGSDEKTGAPQENQSCLCGSVCSAGGASGAGSAEKG